MSFATEIVTGPSLSEAWLNAVRTVDKLPGRTAYHLITQIAHPGNEQLAIRAAAEQLSSELGHPSIETVANTIFPEQLARSCRDHEELSRRYRAMYPTIRSLLPINRNGTYFGRLVSYPAVASSDFNQLADLVRKLRVELSTPRPKAARFELDLADVGADGYALGDTSAGPAEGGPELESADTADQIGGTELPGTPVYVPGQDRSAMGFPCLSFCSFQLDHGALHMVAHYRRQKLVHRGYGNYLGLARLLRYVGEAGGVEPGQLTVVAGAADADAARWRVVRLAESTAQPQAVESKPASTPTS